MSSTKRERIVNSHNEWDPLEEVIVGSLDGACVPPWDAAYRAMIPAESVEMVEAFHRAHGARRFEEARLGEARQELDEFVRVLKAEGVVVRRPEGIDHAQSFSTPDFASPSGNAQSNPRDVLIVIGDEIIEANMGWRSRYFEFRAYRKLVMEYFEQGARWTSAPKAMLSDRSYNPAYDKRTERVLTEEEPVFDAADISRFGRDLFFQRSHVSNRKASQWLQRHLGDGYRVHLVEFEDDRAVHIDATFAPLAPGKLLVNPDRPMRNMPDMFRRAGWELLVCPRTTYPSDRPEYRSFEWLHLNVLSLDAERVIVEKHEEPLIRQLRDWGFTPIPVAFRSNYKHGGSFHCATVDVRRQGTLESYF
ncbi:amidinotransferase [soil metagenome]